MSMGGGGYRGCPFFRDGHVVDRVKTLVKVNCGGGWGESNNEGDDE
jgi:hypothetical protein